MKRAREEFIELFNEIQTEDDLCVFWKSQFPCLPSFRAAKEEKPTCSGLTLIQNSDGPREATLVESNIAKGDQAISKENPKNPCAECDENRLPTIFTQLLVKKLDEPVREDKDLNSQTLFSDDHVDSKKLLSEFESRDTIHQLPVSNECFEKPTIVEQDSKSTKSFVNSDESQEKHSKTTFNKQECHQSPENKVCVTKDKVNYSQDLNNDEKNIETTNSSLSLKLFGKEDKSESLTLDSTFTDVTSVWGSVQSLSSSGM